MSGRPDATDDPTDGDDAPRDGTTTGRDDATGRGGGDPARDRRVSAGPVGSPEIPASRDVDLDALEDTESDEPTPTVRSETRRGKILRPAVAGLVVGLVAGALLGLAVDAAIGIPLRDVAFFAVAGGASGLGGAMAYGAAHDEELVVES